MADVTVRGVDKNFGAVHAINGVAPGIRDGEVRIQLGPSNGGKPTLLRKMAGLAMSSGGVLYVGERVMSRLEPPPFTPVTA